MSVPDTALGTVKRTLRVTKWLSMTPAVGVCTACNPYRYVFLVERRTSGNAIRLLLEEALQHRAQKDSGVQS